SRGRAAATRLQTRRGWASCRCFLRGRRRRRDDHPQSLARGTGKMTDRAAMDASTDAGKKALHVMVLGAIGVVFGDLGTSPLYTFSEAFSDQHGMPVVLAAVLGAALFFGDGVITPSITVLSAVEGLGVATPALSHWVMWIAVI